MILIAGWGAAVAVITLLTLAPSSSEYRGEQIKLTKFYLDYDNYKSDPKNIDPSEVARVQRRVSSAPSGASESSCVRWALDRGAAQPVLPDDVHADGG